MDPDRHGIGPVALLSDQHRHVPEQPVRFAEEDEARVLRLGQRHGTLADLRDAHVHVAGQLVDLGAGHRQCGPAGDTLAQCRGALGIGAHADHRRQQSTQPRQG